uniref:Glutamate decarboxylase 1 n=1 Tax=Amphiprion percula TaxID=161767 RepID=A0A3P8TVX5_AMPPE
MAASAPSSSGGEADPNSTNLRPPGYDAWCGVAHGCTRKLGMKICGKGWRASTWSSPTSQSPWSRSWWTAGTP